MEVGKKSKSSYIFGYLPIGTNIKNLTIGRFLFLFKIWRIWAIFFNRLKSLLLVEIIIFQVGICQKLASKRNAADDSLLGMFPQQGALPIIKAKLVMLSEPKHMHILKLRRGEFLTSVGGGRLSLFIDNHLIRFSQKL
jgi:hypothetical protein